MLRNFLIGNSHALIILANSGMFLANHPATNHTQTVVRKLKNASGMIFKGVDNQSVEFRITNYEFPNITDCEYDSNWLLIYLNVKSKCGNWKTIDPSLLTSDVKRIIKWLNELSMNKTTEKNLSFLEPNLEFNLIQNQIDLKTVRISFDLESRPKTADDEKEYYVDCELNNTELKKVAEELSQELEPFPERAIG